MEFALLETCLPAYSFIHKDIIMLVCTYVFDTFHPLSCDVLSSIIQKLNKITCVLDPFPTKLLMSNLYYILYSTYYESLFLVWGFQHLISLQSFPLCLKSRVWILRFWKTIGLLQIFHLFLKKLKKLLLPKYIVI